VTAVDRDPASCAVAAAGSGQGCIVALRALRFVRHRTIDLPISMDARCDGVVCPEGQTCAAGACAAAAMQSEPSPGADAAVGHGRGHGGGNGGGGNGD
jgi:hypothetical protein